MIDFTTLEYPNGTAVQIGTFIDQNNVSHNLYRRRYQIAGWGALASGAYLQKTINLQSYTVLDYSFSLWRPNDGVINTIGEDINVLLVGSGESLRLYNRLGVALNGNETLFGYIDYMD